MAHHDKTLVKRKTVDKNEKLFMGNFTRTTSSLMYNSFGTIS